MVCRGQYETELTGKHGQFEIKGVPKEVLSEFSQRRAEILAKAEELGISSPKGLDKVTTNTRDPKLNVEDRLSLRDSWRDRAAALGFDGKALLAQAIGRSERGGSETGLRTERGLNEVLTGIREAVGSIFSPRDPLVDRGLDRLGLTASEYRAQHAVASAVRILEQREAAFSVPEVTRTALDLGLAGVTAEKVDARISELVREEKLIPGKSDRIDGIVTHVTTPDALATESKTASSFRLRAQHAHGARHHGRQRHRSDELDREQSLQPAAVQRAVVQLIDPRSGAHALSVFVAANDDVDVPAPAGRWRMRIIEGQRWHGPKDFFGPNTQFETVAKLMEFPARGGNGINLHRRFDGNLPTRQMLTGPDPL